jgi:hypothetical protein
MPEKANDALFFQKKSAGTVPVTVAVKRKKSTRRWIQYKSQLVVSGLSAKIPVLFFSPASPFPFRCSMPV